MHLRSITMKGFKSFPDRTRLEFAEGVSVIVGPNGSGKSNVTDAVLWALGEQSPLAVRGQTMQDVIFSGGAGIACRGAAEVEVVIDDSERELGSEFAELSITRRLHRSGDGEYRLNGARCRLVDVIEALSDTGLGKEMHSVVSQGRVESVIHSSARERRLLIEEAAGLGKHRKRRRRAELKLSRTEENLSRALDVEREARSHLRPLKRQAEAADLHERLERQSLEARLELARDDARVAHERLARGELEAASARTNRDGAERRLNAIRARREAAERAFAEQGRAREAVSARLFAATTSADRVEMRLERVREISSAATADGARIGAELHRLEGAGATDGEDAVAGGGPERPVAAPTERVQRLETELAALDAASGERFDGELERLRERREDRERRRAALEDALGACRAAATAAEAEVAPARAGRRAAEAALEAARSDHARARAELDAVTQLARTAAAAPGEAGALAEHLRVEPGYELALAAALGPLVRAGMAAGLDEGSSLLDAGVDDAGTVIVERSGAPSMAGGASIPSVQPPLPAAERLLDRVSPTSRAAPAVERLLADAWVVESLTGLPDRFRGIAVTRSGRALIAGTGELRQATPGAEERLLERLSRRDELAGQVEEELRRVQEAERRAEAAASTLSGAEDSRDRAGEALRAAIRDLEAADDAARGAERAVTRREEAADQSLAVRRAELVAELRAERRVWERAERERAERRRRCETMRARIVRSDVLRRSADGVVSALESALVAIAAHRDSLRAELDAGREVGDRTGKELRGCAHDEAELQGELRRLGELVTAAEVTAQRARDAAAEAERELGEVATRLGLEAPLHEAPEAVSQEDREELLARLERLGRRRDRLGPVNPLAKDEYEEAVARVEELESQRGDLERALAELRGIIRETDHRIRESFEQTFEATARNFEEVAEELFPGGRGRLRLVAPGGPRPVLGGESDDAESPEPRSEDRAAGIAAGREAGGEALLPDGDEEADAGPGEPGVEVEVTPAGKSMRRLSLMSGGERSLVALAFLFAVFLARPCPFYVLDEVEAALDDLNIDRFLRLVRRCADRAQFIVVTHQKRTMDAADCLYGISMGGDGVSKVVSRRLARSSSDEPAAIAGDEAAA
jgi:chromosome segregation protein